MLDHQIESTRQEAVEAILRHYRNWYLPHVMLTPSARFGLYITAKTLLSRGDRVLVSPITCRTVIDALLEAGVVPVFVDIELSTGNIDVSRLSKSVLNNARAIITTNLYGSPDAIRDLRFMANTHKLLLIEDCAHVLRTRVETRELGTFGDVSVFSFKKHFDEVGGIICARDAAHGTRIQGRLIAEGTMPSAQEERLRFCQYRLMKATSPSIVRRLSAVYRHLVKVGGHHQNAEPARDFRSTILNTTFPTIAALLRVLEFLRRREQLIAARTAAARTLIARCPLPMTNGRYNDDVVYLAVPFFSSNRDAVVGKLRARGIPMYFLYTPPMNVLFPDRTYSVPNLDQDRIDHWCRHILPVPPQCGEQFLEVIHQSSALWKTCCATIADTRHQSQILASNR